MNYRFTSLRTTLLLPFVGLITCVALAIGAISYWTGMRAVDAFSVQLLGDVTYRVEQAIGKHLSYATLALNAVAPDAASTLPNAPAAIDQLAPLAMADIERRLWLNTEIFREVSNYIYFGTPDGRFIGVTRGAEGDEVRVRESLSEPRRAYRSTGPGLRGEVLRSDDFDPRQRPWYKTALQAQGIAWTPIYVSTTSNALTITLAKPVYDAKRALYGVVATDVPLTSLDQFVGSLKVSQTGVAFIVDANGDLVATSSAERLVFREQGQPARIKASASVNPLIRSAYAAYLASTQRGKPSADRVAHFESDVGTVDLAAKSQTDRAGLNWTTLVAIPRADHMGDLRSTVLQSVAIGVVALILTILFGVWFSQRIVRDIRRLSDATKLLASGHAPEHFDTERNDELGSIARSMEEMSSELLIDPLTGALNRVTFAKRFDAMFAGATPNGPMLGALVFIDLNDFKQINDQYGHAVGDALLAVTAQRLSSVLRRTDALGRFGGDEFMLLLACADQAAVDATIARCRDRLTAPVHVAGHSITVSAAFGSVRVPTDGSTLQQLIAVADRNMYADKGQQQDDRSTSNSTDATRNNIQHRNGIHRFTGAAE